MAQYHQLIFKLQIICTHRPIINMKNTRADMGIQTNQELLEHKTINHLEAMHQGPIAQIRPPAVTPSRVKWSERNQKTRLNIVARKEINKPEVGIKMAQQIMKADMAERVETLMIVKMEVKGNNNKLKLPMHWRSIFMRLTDSQLKHPPIIEVATRVMHNVISLEAMETKAPTTSNPD